MRTRQFKVFLLQLFAMISIFNIPESEEELLQSLEMSEDQLHRIFLGAPSAFVAFPRLAPSTLTRQFYQWFDSAVDDADRFASI
jgi:hypothetical protein